MQELKKQNIWLIWVLRDKKKLPFSALTGYETGTSQEYASKWTDYDTAAKKLDEVPSKKRQGGLGFVVPKGFFFLDVDHQELDSPLIQELRKVLPTYCEVSPSGHGVHFYGKCDLSKLPTVMLNGELKLSKDYYSKNSKLGLELYIGGLTNRFSTFTGKQLSSSSQLTDCTSSLLEILEQKMKKVSVEPLDETKFVKLTNADIPIILDDLRKQKNGDKFISLFDRGIIPDGKTPSEADVSLCALIAFRAGPNPELIDSIFRESSLYRDKWERTDYATRTIEAGIESCHGNFHPAVKKDPDLPPFVIVKKGKLRVDAAKLYTYTREKIPYIIVRDSAKADSNIFVHKNGVYVCYGKEVFGGVLKNFIESYNPDLLDVSVIDKAVSLVCKQEDFIGYKDLNTDARFINMKNGLLDVRTMELLPHDPKVYSTIQLPIEYDPSKWDTPVFDSYLDTLCDGAEDKKRFLLEYMGACFSNVPGKRFKKSLFMFGPGDTGKSVLKSLTEMLLGDGNYMGIDLRQMEARFGSSSIFGKRLAGSADISFMTIAELNIFKQATGGDSIQAEYKGKDKFEFKYNGLFWFCMNRLPKFGGDDGKWVYDRIIPFHCPNVIKKKDKELVEKLFSERQGIFNKVMRSFQPLMSNDYNFHEPAEAAVIRDQYRVDNNSALEFFSTMMEERRGDVKREEEETVNKVYAAYKSWYQRQNPNSRFIKTRKDFFNDIAEYLEVDYDSMKKKSSNGLCLKDYKLTKEAVEGTYLI